MRSVQLISVTIVAGILCLFWDLSNMQTQSFQQWVVTAFDKDRTVKSIYSHADEFCDEPSTTLSEGLVIISVANCEERVSDFLDRDAVIVYNEEELIVPKEGRRYSYLMTSIFFVVVGVWFTYLVVSKPLR